MPQIMKGFLSGLANTFQLCGSKYLRKQPFGGAKLKINAKQQVIAATGSGQQ